MAWWNLGFKSPWLHCSDNSESRFRQQLCQQFSCGSSVWMRTIRRCAKLYRTTNEAENLSSSGEVINGLARRPSDGRWRVIGSDITFAESDEQLAIHRYLTVYKPAKTPAAISFAVPVPDPLTRVEDLPVLTRLNTLPPGNAKRPSICRRERSGPGYGNRFSRGPSTRLR
jgi:hypothetical protein